MEGETHVILVKIPPGRIKSFRGKGWVGVEIIADERPARARFHALRPALYALGAGGVLVRALVDADQKVSELRPLMAKDAEFWRLRGQSLRMASREQIAEWTDCAAALIAADAADIFAGRAGQKHARRSALTFPAIATASASFAFVLAAGLVTRQPATAPNLAAEANTSIVSDPRDPTYVMVYAVSDDGTRRLLRRITREQFETSGSGPPASAESKPKTLLDGITAFLRVRQ